MAPQLYSDLAEGPHDFRVQAIDPAGNVDTSPATRPFTVERPSDLGVVLSATPNPVKRNGELTYTVRVSNNGPAESSSVSLVHALPPEATVVSVRTPAGMCTPASGGPPVTVSCSIDVLPAGSSVTVSVVVKVNAKRGQLLTSRAQVSGPRFDPDTTNNAASVATTVR